MKNCYCNSNKLFSECCEPYVSGIQKAPTSLALMRSRYTAYCVQNVNYLLATTHVSTRKQHNMDDILEFASKNQWTKLEILNSSETIVEFKAHYIDSFQLAQIHYEKSTFKQEEGSWYYVDGEWT